MATLERQGYKAYREPDKRKYEGGLGNYLGDSFRLAGDNVLSVFGANDVITDESYKTKEFESIAKVTNPLYSVAGKVSAEYLAPGIGGNVMGAVQGSVGQMTQSDTPQGYEGYNDIINSLSQIGSQFIGGTPNLPKLAKYGGSMNKKSSYKIGGNLITIPGRKHTDGGTNIGNNAEAEINEEYYQLGEDFDFIFSNADELKFGGKTPASMARKIKSKYSLRPYDKLSKDSKEMELNALMQKQESLKESLGMDNDMNMFLLGGEREGTFRKDIRNQSINPLGSYGNTDKTSFNLLQRALGESYDLGSFEDFIQPENTKKFQQWAGIPDDGLAGEQTFSYRPQLTMTSKEVGQAEQSTLRGTDIKVNVAAATAPVSVNNNPEDTKDIISPFNLNKAKQLGNIATGAQLATAIPGLTTRASDVNYDRVTAPEIDLSAQRRASELSRNRIIASNRAGARGADSVGMALNFLGAANAGAQGQYGNEIAQSFLSEEQFNKQSEFEASKINADISRAEQEARIAEEDAARSMQLQSLADMAGYIGMGAAGQNQLSMAEGQINMLQNMGDFIYGMDENGNPVIRKKDKVTASKYGGIIKRNRRK